MSIIRSCPPLSAAGRSARWVVPSLRRARTCASHGQIRNGRNRTQGRRRCTDIGAAFRRGGTAREAAGRAARAMASRGRPVPRIGRRSRDRAAHSRPGRIPARRAGHLWLAGAIFLGGIVGPVLLMWGLAHASASSASLLLNAEGVLTALIAWFVFKENFWSFRRCIFDSVMRSNPADSRGAPPRLQHSRRDEDGIATLRQSATKHRS